MAVVSEAAGGRTFPRLHWSAVIAGVFLAVAVHIVMGLVGAALGFAAEPADSEGLGAAAAIWALITPFVATLLGGWLACRMAGTEDDTRASTVHSVLVWCIGLIAGALFLTGTLATGAIGAGAAASGNPAQRFLGDPARPGPRAAEVRAEDAARRAAAATGGAALGAISGLLGAVVAATIARRRSEGKGLGWRIAIQRREERHAGPFTHERGYTGTSTSYGTSRPPGTATGSPPDVSPPTDPYHH